MKLLFLIISFLGICLPDATQEKKPVCKKPRVEKTSFQLMPSGLIVHI